MGDDSGPEDNEAVIIEEKKKIEETLKNSEAEFTSKQMTLDKKNQTGNFKIEDDVKPKITRRLGIGLAALVTQKTLVKQAELKRKEEEELAAKREVL